MATGGGPASISASSKERTNYARLCRAIVDIGANILRKILANQIPSSQIRHKANNCRNLMKRLNPSQTNILNTATHPGYVSFDVSFLYTLIRNLCSRIVPSSAWSTGTLPRPADITEGDDVKRIHFIRNNVYGHLTNTRIPDGDFNQYWQILEDVSTRTDALYNTQYAQDLAQLKTCCMDDETESNHIQTIQDLAEADKEIRLEVQQLKKEVHDLRGHNRKAAENQEETSTMLDDHRKDNTYLNTQAAEDGLQKLEDNGVLIYSGVAGSGKSSNSVAVASRFAKEHQEYTVMSVNDITKWESYMSPKVKALVVFDDFLGSTNLNKTVLEEGKKFWPKMHSAVKSGRLKVIMTTRHHILEEALLELKKSKLFDKKYIIKLSSTDYALSDEKRLKMFERHAKVNKITITDEEENYHSEDVLDDDTEVTINRYTVNRIIRSEPGMGYPQAVFLFCSDRNYTRLGCKFFEHPSESLVREMENLKTSSDSNEKLKFCILVYMLMKKKQMDVETIDNEVWSQVTETFELQRSPNVSTIKDVVNSITNKYITNVGKTYIYKFKHETILEAVAVSLANSNVKLLLKYCDRRFIEEFIRTKQYTVKEGEVVIVLKSTSEYECLAHRSIPEMINDRYGWIDHPAVDDPEFVSCLLNTIQSNDEYVQGIRRKLTGDMFKWACVYDRYHLVDALYTGYRRYINTRDCLRDAGPVATKWLLDHQVDVDNIMLAMNSCNTEKTDVMLSHPAVQLKHLAEDIDKYGCPPYSTRYSTVNIILYRWPDIDMNYVNMLLLFVFLWGGESNDMSTMLRYPVVQRSNVTKYLYSDGNPPDGTARGNLKAMLDLWPDIDMKYVDVLLDYVFSDGASGTTAELNAILCHPTVQLTHLTRFINSHRTAPQHTGHSTVKVILDRWPNIDMMYADVLLRAVFFFDDSFRMMLWRYDSGTTAELDAFLRHPTVQLTHLTRFIDKEEKVPLNTEYSTVKVILDRWPDIDMKYVDVLLTYVFSDDYDRSTTEELNDFLCHPTVQLTHLTQYIDLGYEAPLHTDYSTVKVILDRWPDIEAEYVEGLLRYVSSEDIYYSTVKVILDKCPDIDTKNVNVLFRCAISEGEGTTTELNDMLDHPSPAVQQTDITEWLCSTYITQILGKTADYRTIEIILNRWPNIETERLEELFSILKERKDDKAVELLESFMKKRTKEPVTLYSIKKRKVE